MLRTFFGPGGGGSCKGTEHQSKEAGGLHGSGGGRCAVESRASRAMLVGRGRAVAAGEFLCAVHELERGPNERAGEGTGSERRASQRLQSGWVSDGLCGVLNSLSPCCSAQKLCFGGLKEQCGCETRFPFPSRPRTRLPWLLPVAFPEIGTSDRPERQGLSLVSRLSSKTTTHPTPNTHALTSTPPTLRPYPLLPRQLLRITATLATSVRHPSCINPLPQFHPKKATSPYFP